MKKKTNKIKNMVKSELKSLSKITDVSTALKKLDKLENNYKKKKYKSFREQSIECSKNATCIEVSYVSCGQINLICKKYNCYCHSKACLGERTK